MSWDVSLHAVVDGSDICIPGADWNHTHNCNKMIYAVMRDLGITTEASWWKQIHDRTAGESDKFMADVIAGLEAEPARFMAMNPENGWGSYDSLLQVLKEMRSYGLKFPSAKWDVWG